MLSMSPADRRPHVVVVRCNEAKSSREPGIAPPLQAVAKIKQAFRKWLLAQ